MCRAAVLVLAASLSRAAILVVAAAWILAPADALTARQQAGGPSVQHFDVLITGGRVLDGTGNPWFFADVGIRGGEIAAVGRLDGATADRVVEAAGRIVAPGFIDLHSHADGALASDDARRRAAPNMIAQGATTLVVNQDGRSPWPLTEQRATMERLGTGPNVIQLIGHGQIRREVMGDDFQRPATADEVRRMRALVRQGMAEGAYGVSAALEYVPGRWAETDELVEIVREIVPYGGIYIAHQRSEGADPMWYWPSQDPPGPPNLLESVVETIEIGERTGAVVVASHIKAKGANYFGSGHAAIQLIERARARGVQIYADQYPYNTSGSDGNTRLIPGWVRDAAQELAGPGAPRPGWADAVRRVLADPESAAALRLDIDHEIDRRGGAEQVVVLDYVDRSYVGKSLGELAEGRGMGAVDMAIALQLEGDGERQGGAHLRGFSMSEYDIEAYAAQPWTATASDAGVALPGQGLPHARFYGTFPRKIRHYALDRGVISVEDAVRSMTSLPAQILGLRDRGLIREGYRADVVVFELDRIRDRADFFEPHQYPDGIDYVLVNGRFVVDAGELTRALPGRIITPAGSGPGLTAVSSGE